VADGGGVVVVVMDQSQQGWKSQQRSSNNLGAIDNFRTLEVTPAAKSREGSATRNAKYRLHGLSLGGSRA
jgi:hypothetical protein